MSALEKWQGRALSFYHSSAVQAAVGLVILGSYFMSIADAQVMLARAVLARVMLARAVLARVMLARAVGGERSNQTPAEVRQLEGYC